MITCLHAHDISAPHTTNTPTGAHHLDLRGPHQADPPNVTRTREREEEIIWGWIQQYMSSQDRVRSTNVDVRSSKVVVGEGREERQAA